VRQARYFEIGVLVVGCRVKTWEHAEQVIGRERRKRVSQLTWCGEGRFDSRRRVNSSVIAYPILKTTPAEAQIVSLTNRGI